MISSQQYKEREKQKIIELKKQVEPMNLNNQLKIEYEFYMPDRRKTDLSNKVESINDMFVEYGLLEDDNWQIIKEMQITCLWIEKDNPRCEVSIYSLTE